MKSEEPITIIVSGRNSETTIVGCLESLAAQDYPIDRILAFDNASTDRSVALMREVAAKSRVPIEIVEAEKGGTLSTSYNRGVEMARTPVVVLSHSDCVIPTPGELRKLVAPFADETVAVAYPVMDMPREVWRKFPFWQKIQFVNFVDRPTRSICAMFDAYRTDAYRKVGGFDAARFTATCGFGGEDSDMAWRVAKVGKTADTPARVNHVHALAPVYSIVSYVKTRSMLARTYGKIIQHQRGFAESSNLLLFVRPLLMLLPLAAVPFGLSAVLAALGLQFLFGLAYCRQAFATPEARADVRILALPFVQWFMLYWEGVWFFHGLLTPPRARWQPVSFARHEQN